MKYEKGCAIIDIRCFIEELLRSADKETQRDMLDSLSCLDPVIDHVVAQVIDGCTEFDSWGPTDYPSKSEPRDAIDRARRHIASNANETAKAEIGRLEQALRVVEEAKEKAERRYDRALFYMEGFSHDARSRFFDATYDEPKAVAK